MNYKTLIQWTDPAGIRHEVGEIGEYADVHDRDDLVHDRTLEACAEPTAAEPAPIVSEAVGGVQVDPVADAMLNLSGLLTGITGTATATLGDTTAPEPDTAAG